MAINIVNTEFPLKIFHATPKATIGWGAYQMAGEDAKKIGIKHALLITTGLESTGIIDEIKGVLNYAGVETTIFSQVSPNPKDHEVHAAHKAYKEAQCDGVVSVGGGSSHDCAKAMRIVESQNGRSIRDFNGVNEFETSINIPHLAITTTSGTGSETTYACVITDTEKLFKMLIFEPSAHATRAIIDPALMRNLPQKLTAYTGLDALVHAVEAYTSRLNVVTSWGIALHAIELIGKHLRDAYGNGNNAEAREGMAWAQYCGGHAINSGAACVVHSIAHSLGGLLDAPHGLCNSIAFIPVQRFNMVACPEKFANIGRALGVNTAGMTTIQAAERAVDEMERLINDLDITERFADIGLKEENIDQVAEYAFKDFACMVNPREVNTDTIKMFLRQCM
ncbi:MAG: iron-containing alcohol dehydrogenase [Clostridia bacterium]|jgi:alcohol dehydrogenase class IV|nr:iron-containing alcohol dehydrogenase [Clostridia bacterium]